ncbi:hypothetical protein FH972_015139 [Carpinus fangiana]|uniref:Uncharacterized protein n=1 Tax=Carpinus fangiana TaxID=176857 RepID=A0A5N6RC61_9ROSI|nr:hypothetical protein FH972_015139 [Carpinus fangiana]
MHTCHMDQRSVLHAGKAKTTADQPAAFLLPFPRGLTSQCPKAKNCFCPKVALVLFYYLRKSHRNSFSHTLACTSMFIVPKQGVFLGIKL